MEPSFVKKLPRFQGFFPWSFAGNWKSADCKRGRRKGATSKIVKKCQKYFRHFSRRAKNVKNRQKVSKSFSTLFDNFRAAPFFRPLLQSAEKNIYHHHHPESKKRKSSEENSGSIQPYGRYGNAGKTSKAISTIAILWPVKAIFEKRAAIVAPVLVFRGTFRPIWPNFDPVLTNSDMFWPILPGRPDLFSPILTRSPGGPDLFSHISTYFVSQ